MTSTDTLSHRSVATLRAPSVLATSDVPGRRPPALARRILIVECDLYTNIGGGQSSYRKIIETCSDDRYFYFSRDEDVAAPRPDHVTAIPLRTIYRQNVGDLDPKKTYLYHPYLEMWQFAASVRSALGPFRFDVVDTPDYRVGGAFVRRALEAHGIDVGVVALALHGTISSALSDQWPHTSASRRTLSQLRVLESMQYRVADVRYALSEAYAQDWRDRTGIGSNLIDPLHVVGAIEPAQAAGPATEPDVVFIGRRERRKGPDLFADLVWCLDPATYGRALVVGSESLGQSGVGSNAVLAEMTRLRRCSLSIEAHRSPAELEALFAGRSVVVLPSRYDQFNLVALESLRRGCPTFVSRRAGAARWIETRYPRLADLVVDIDCSRSAAARVQRALDDYDNLRDRIVEVLKAGDRFVGRRDLVAMYAPGAPRDEGAQQALNEIATRFDSFNRPRLIDVTSPLGVARRVAGERLSPDAKATLRGAKAGLRSTLRGLIGVRRWRPSLAPVNAAVANLLEKRRGLSRAGVTQIRSARDVEGTRSRLLTLGERTKPEVAVKLARISAELGSIRVARVQVFRDMARLERKRDNDLIAATYCLRVMRWVGRDRFGDLDFVARTLTAAGYAHEAEAARAMFGPASETYERCRALLDEQYRRNVVKPDLPLAILDDRRSAAQPKVSVIVSLYGAETKLRTLLDNIAAQSLAHDGRVEVVLVDSASPTDEYAVFQAYASTSALPLVYARSHRRETIQAAWNRGIKLARAPYLTFLGADEGMHPACLAALAQVLDDRPSVDWAMADSIVTEVDRDGVLDHDVMIYDRAGFDPALVRLETCYLSWVAGLYRRSVHDRFGWYDETFRAAGDTEFKGRVLTHLETAHVPRPLGVFNNYPEARTTQNPRAEIEDLRAWYLHRTPAGVAYSYDAHPVAAAQDLFRRSLTYRKSFCAHWSTDFDLASATAAYLVARGEDPAFAQQASRSSARLLSAVERADTLDLQLKPRVRQFSMLKTLLEAKACEREDKAAFGLSGPLAYDLFNDNRYEQHWWSWSV